VVRQQTGLVVQELCRWRSGYFRFEVAPVASRGEIGVDAEDLVVPGGVATDQILLEAMTRLDEEDPTPRSVDARSLATASLSPVLRAETTVDLLRRAAAVAPRGLLLLVRGDEVRGAGQFGFDPGAAPDDLAHSIHLSLAEPTVVTEAVERRETWKGEIPATPPNEGFLERLGGTRPKEAVVVPMLPRDGMGLVVYGDDAGNGRPLDSVEDLEWALLEAGLSMERDLLEDRMRAFEQARGYRP
jgi:hypothetical protein